MLQIGRPRTRIRRCIYVKAATPPKASSNILVSCEVDHPPKTLVCKRKVENFEVGYFFRLGIFGG